MASSDTAEGGKPEGRLQTQEGLQTNQKPGSIIPIQEWPGGNCSIHFTQQLNMFCEQCSQLLCVDCYCSSHQGHYFVPVTKKEEEIRGKLKGVIKEFELELDNCDLTSSGLTEKIVATKRLWHGHLTQLWDRHATALANLNEHHERAVSKLDKDLAARSSMVKQELSSAVMAAKARCRFATNTLKTAATENLKKTREGRCLIRETNNQMLEARLPQLWKTLDVIGQVRHNLPDNTTLVTRHLQSPARAPEFTNKLGLTLGESLIFSRVEALWEEEEKKKKRGDEKARAEDDERRAKAKKPDVTEQKQTQEGCNRDKSDEKTETQKKEKDGIHVLSKKLVGLEINDNTTSLQKENTEVVARDKTVQTKRESDLKKDDTCLKGQAPADKPSAETRSSSWVDCTPPASSVKQTQKIKASPSATPSKEQVEVKAERKEGECSMQCSNSGVKPETTKPSVQEMRKKLKLLVPSTPSNSICHWDGFGEPLEGIAIMETERQGLVDFIQNKSGSTLASFKWDLDVRPLRWSNSAEPAAVDVAFLSPLIARNLMDLIGGSPTLVLEGDAPFFNLTCTPKGKRVKYRHAHVFDERGHKRKEIGNWFLPATWNLQKALEDVLGYSPTRIADSTGKEFEGSLQCNEWVTLRRGRRLYIK